MKIKLLLLLTFIFSLHINAAQFCVGKYKKEQRLIGVQRKTIVVPSRPPLFCKTPIGGNHDIIFLICANYDKLEDAAKTVNALAQTNKFLNTLIDDKDRTLRLIKSLSIHFKCSNMFVAESLYTRAANFCYLMQQQFYANWTGGSNTVKRFPRLKSMGLDPNFTYGGYSYPALLRNVIWEEIGYAEVGKWIIENGADINVVDQNNSSAFMLALKKGNWVLIPLFLKHDSLKIHHQDNQGNVLLHYCIEKLETVKAGNNSYQTECRDILLDVIKQLLAKGADPTIKNNDGATPLDLAYAIEYQPTIDLLTKARADFTPSISR